MISSLTHAAEGIKITGARWGNKNVTKEAGNFCDGKLTCSYKVSPNFIPVPTNSDKSFHVTWICGDDKTKIYKLSEPSNAQGKILEIGCKKEVVKPKTAQRKDVDPETVAYYEDLLRKYQENPNSITLEDFKKTFFPMEAIPKDENLLSCTNSLGVGNCNPDTFYSWGPSQKMKNAKAATGSKTWETELNNGRSIYMNQSSIGSYCYGLYPLRFKMKSKANPGGLNKGTFKNTFNEWIIRDSNEIESVSFAQPEHIDEVVTEIMRRLDKKSEWHKSALYVDFLLYGKDQKELIYNGCVPEVYQFSEQSMVKSVMTLIQAYLNGEGWINSRTCQGECDGKEHFSTKWPTFFNPK